MFGYVLPSAARLTEEDKSRFGGVYCGLCRTLAARYGQAARTILNYDFTFLAVLFWPQEEGNPLHGGCMVHPIAGRDYFPENNALALAADESVILAWWQIQDALADPGKGKMKYRAASGALKGAFCRARERRPAFDGTVRRQLEELRRLEEAKCASLDEPADAFARLLSAAAEAAAEPVKRRVLEQLLYHLGRWIYLVDAADDLAKDFASGNYNPLLCHFALEKGELTEAARESLTVTLDHSIRLMAAAFELWDFGVWSSIIRATVYEGLFLVGRAVLEGTFQSRDAVFRLAGRNKEQL